MKLDTFEDLLVHELKDLLSAEKQLLKALPKMAKGAANEKLRDGFLEHLEQTKTHVQRLEQAFEHLGKTARAEHCNGMEGLIEEGSEQLEQSGEPSVLDAGLIGAARRVEHYEMAGYCTASLLAEKLGQKQILKLLQQTFEEEQETDSKLKDLLENQIPAESHAAS
jgi:ferritin-like metal-binding protein YciE